MTETRTETRPSPMRRFLRKRWPWLLGGTLLVGSAAFAPHAFAGPFHHGRHGRHFGHASSPEEAFERMQRHVGRVLDRVDATDAQRAKVDAIVREASKEWFDLHSELDKARTELKKTLLADKIDQARVATLKARSATLAQRASEAVVENLTDVAEVLTPEQRRKIAEHFGALDP